MTKTDLISAIAEELEVARRRSVDHHRAYESYAEEISTGAATDLAAAREAAARHRGYKLAYLATWDRLNSLLVRANAGAR